MVKSVTNRVYMFDTIIGELRRGEEARLNRLKLNLIQKNTQMGGKEDGFYYRGLVFSGVDDKLYSKARRGTLNPELFDQANMIVEQERKLGIDMNRIHQAIALMIVTIASDKPPGKNDYTLQELRDALHEGLVECVPELKNLPRLNVEAWCLRDKPVTYATYLTFRPIIEEYVAMRLING